MLRDPSSDDAKVSKPLPFSEAKSPPQSRDDEPFPLSLNLKNDSGLCGCSFDIVEKDLIRNEGVFQFID